MVSWRLSTLGWTKRLRLAVRGDRRLSAATMIYDRFLSLIRVGLAVKSARVMNPQPRSLLATYSTTTAVLYRQLAYGRRGRVFSHLEPLIDDRIVNEVMRAAFRQVEYTSAFARFLQVNPCRARLERVRDQYGATRWGPL